MTPTLTRIVRDPALRAHPLALQILLVSLSELESHGLTAISVREMARHLNTDPKSIRRALRWLSRTWITLVGRQVRGEGLYVWAKRDVAACRAA